MYAYYKCYDIMYVSVYVRMCVYSFSKNIQCAANIPLATMASTVAKRDKTLIKKLNGHNGLDWKNCYRYYVESLKQMM